MSIEISALLLTARVAAKLMAISERTLFGLTKTGEVPCIRIGRSVRYDPADLKAWIEKRKTAVNPAEKVPS